MRRPAFAGVAALALVSAVAACSGSGTAPTSATGDTGTTGLESPADGSVASSGPAGDTSVRIGNFYADQNLVAGPALDLYDTPVGQAATPILTAVPHGSFSDYVHPHESGGAVLLYVLPTGEDPVANKADDKGVGGYMDNGSKLQETLVLASEGKSGSGCMAPGPICELDVNTVIEKGDDANGGTGPVASPPAAGKGELLVSTHVLQDENLHSEYYFFVDASCDPALNGDASQEPGLPYIFATSAPEQSIFPTTPGTHQISVVAYPQGTLPTCAALAPKQGQTSVTVADGQQTLVYVYGTSDTDLHLAIGPIQP